VGLVLGVPLAYGVPTVMAVVAELSGFSIVEGTYFAQIPTDVRLPDILVIALVSLLISMAATIYPSARAARLEPDRILRYE
ncbi:MAG: lipoprotein-releasing system transmembrane subunit LolC, partial [Proteobacteria bacterium]|nr:lipoprotein-releasing system transmembrane subunit LolC [Pseudomonadota bacterium]